MQEQASDFFCLFCFFLLSQLSEPGRLGTALSGPASRLAVMFVSPQKHTVTREGHEVRDSVSENISKEEGRRQERLRHAHILSVCGSLATIVSLGDSYRIHHAPQIKKVIF